jgi:hypothetical protein
MEDAGDENLLEPLKVVAYEGLKIDLCDSDKVWSSGTIVSFTKRRTTRHHSNDSPLEEKSECVVTVAYDGWESTWNERLLYPNPRILRHFSFSRQVKAMVDIQASRQRYTSSNGPEPILLWPCRVQIRMPTPGDKNSMTQLKWEKKVYVEPYLPTKENIIPELREFFPNCEQLLNKNKAYDENAPFPGAWVETEYILPFRTFDFAKYSRRQLLEKKFPLIGFISSYENALKDQTTQGFLPSNLFSEGSLVNDRFRVKNSPGPKFFTGKFSDDINHQDTVEESKPKLNYCLRRSNVRSDSIELSKKRLNQDDFPRESKRKKILRRNLQPGGRLKDFIDERYEWEMGVKNRKPPEEETVWTGVSPIERALVECCNSSIDDENDSLFISSGKELEFVSICAVYCESVADRSLAIAIFQRVNQKCIQNQGHQNDSPDSSIEMPSHIQRKFILSNGGLELFNEWLVESTKSLEVIGEAAPLSRLLIPLVELLYNIPVDFDLVFKTGINTSIGDLYRLIKRRESTLTRKFFSELYILLSQLKNNWSELKKSWKSPIEKVESQNTTRSFHETNPFATLIELMKKQYEILCECEEQGKSTPWDNQVSKISPPKPNILPFSGKTLIQERLEQKQRLREIEQRKAEETKKNMRHMTLGALISKAVSNHNLVKEKSVTARRIHTADNRTADAPRKKRVSFADEHKT